MYDAGTAHRGISKYCLFIFSAIYKYNIKISHLCILKARKPREARRLIFNPGQNVKPPYAYLCQHLIFFNDSLSTLEISFRTLF